MLWITLVLLCQPGQQIHRSQSQTWSCPPPPARQTPTRLDRHGLDIFTQAADATAKYFYWLLSCKSCLLEIFCTLGKVSFWSEYRHLTKMLRTAAPLATSDATIRRAWWGLGSSNYKDLEYSDSQTRHSRPGPSLTEFLCPLHWLRFNLFWNIF